MSRIGRVYGDYEIKKLLPKGVFGCTCTECGARKKLTKDDLIAGPLCSCQDIGVGKVYGDFVVKVDLTADDSPLFGCRCMHCEVKRRFKPHQLRTQPDCKVCARKREQGVTEVVILGDERSPNRIVKDTVGAALSGRQKKALGKSQEFLKQVTDYLPLDPDERLDSENVSSRLLDYVESINNQLGAAGSGTTDGVREFQIETLKTLVELIPLAESAYRDDPRQAHAYTLNALITQSRELMADLMAEDDKGELANELLTRIVHPGFLTLGQAVIDSHYNLLRLVEKEVPTDRVDAINRALNQQTKDLCATLEATLGNMRNQIAQEFV